MVAVEVSIVVEKKEKQYVSDNAQLMAEWDWKRNSELQFDPAKLTCGSGMKVWWKCCNGHSWQATINNRNNGRGCPYCAGKKVLIGYNDLLTINSALAAEWNYLRNGDSKPEGFTANSNKKVWWKCSKGHEWQAIIADRHSGTGCPYCSNQRVLEGLNDLQTVNSTLVAEWNYEKNGDLRPSSFTANSGKIVWWKCRNGHEWKSAINGRNKGAGCPICAGQKVLIGYNDLQTANPTLATEWNFEKNGELKPYDFTANSGKKVWWKCSKGHEWQTTINNRNNGNGCPICSFERKTSFPEYALVYYLAQYGFEPMHLYTEFGYELDVYIPSKKIAIEYDGYLWHKNKIENDLRKNQQCQRDGIKLYRIREGLLPLHDSSVDFVAQRNQKDLPEILSRILCEITGMIVDVNLERDVVAIENLRQHTEKEKSLLSANPNLALEWNYDKNGRLKPENVSPHSNKKVWWTCRVGHEWQAIINSRSRGNGCPVCAGQKVLPGYNDLSTVNPILTVEWSYDKNNGLTPADVMPNSDQKVWWKCNAGHEWQSTISHRNHGRGCPQCAREKRKRNK